jgi:RNA polymerase sigma-70 factor (ECF subfamily)
MTAEARRSALPSRLNGGVIDPSLVRLAREGSKDAFADLFRETFRDVSRYISAIVGDPDRAEDAVSETYLDAWRQLPGLRQEDRFEAWIFRIAHNRAVDELRRRTSEPLETQDELLAPEFQSPAAALDRKVDQERLRQALMDLPRDQREVVLLHQIRGLPHSEIARQMGRREGASRALLHRAVRNLRESVRGD